MGSRRKKERGKIKRAENDEKRKDRKNKEVEAIDKGKHYV